MNHYASHMLFNKGGRHYFFAKYLDQAGYHPVVFCANIENYNTEKRYFDTDALWTVKEAEEINTPFVYVKARTYKGNGRQRILNMIDFYVNVRKAAVEYAEKNGRPDLILASSVHPLTVLAGIQLAKLFKVRCIGEIRDLWPESIIQYGIAGPGHPFVLALRCLEKYLYRKADALIFTGEGFYDYIREKGWEKTVPENKVFCLNNGVDLEAFDANCAKYRLEDSDLSDPEIFKVIYAGSIRRVNNLGLLLDAAKCVSNPRIRFLIWGSGEELEALKERRRAEKIDNVVFKGRVDKQYIPYITTRADLNIAHNEPSSLFRFGISFNKLFDYLAAGRPVLCDFPSKYNPAVVCGAGMEINDPSAERIAAAVEHTAMLGEEEYRRYCRSARAAAENIYNYRSLTERLIQIIESKELI